MPLSSTSTQTNVYSGLLSVQSGSQDIGTYLTALQTALKSKVSAVNPGDPKSMLEANIAMQEFEMMNGFMGSVLKAVADSFDRVTQKM